VTIPEWGADRPLDEGIVRRALAEALPDLKPSTVEPIGSGWDFDTWALGLQRVARFPRRAEVVETTLREARFMPKATAALRPLDIATPEVRALAEPTEAFPYPFLIQRRLWGLPLQALKPGRFSPRLARHLGRCIRAIHDLDCEDGLLEDSTDYADAEIEHALELTDRLDEALADRIAGPLEWLRTGPVGPPSYEGPLAVIHNDLSPEHVRIARNGLTVLGVMDWSDVTRGDPARDFSVLHCWGGRMAVERTLEGYGDHDPGLPERAAWIGRITALPWLQEAAERHGDVDKHIRWIERAFADAAL